MIALFIAILVILLFYFIRLPFNYWKNKNVPHPPVSYLFGNVGSALLFKKSIAEVYDELYKKYPGLNYIGFYKTRTPCILLRDPGVIKEVLVKNFDSFGDNDIFTGVNGDLFAKNPFVSRGHLWKESRSQLAPSFTAKRVKEMYPLIENVAENLVKYIDSNIVGREGGAETKQLFIKYTTDVVTSCALGLDANSFVDPNSDYVKMINLILAPPLLNRIKVLIMFNFPLLSELLKFKFIPDEASKYYTTIVNKTLKHRNDNKVHRGDFLDAMNELRDPKKPTEYDIAGHITTFLTEGTETSSIVLSFTLYELALHGDIQEKLRKEIDDLGGKPSFDAIVNMEYLDQIINESMRKNTLAPLFRRVCTKRYTLESPDGNGPGVVIEPGTPIVVPVHSIHLDPKYYPNPELYDPTRFSDENNAKRLNYTYMPFGEGPRICLGMRFGMAQVKVAIVHVIRNFEIKINKRTAVPYKIDPQHFILGAQGGLWLDFYKR